MGAMSLYAGYFDESGTGSGDVLSVAGYVSTVDAWIKFSTDWQQDLLAWKTLEYFRMHEFMSGQGKYRRMDFTERREVERRAFGIMNRNILFGVYGVISKSAHSRWIAPP